MRFILHVINKYLVFGLICAGVYFIFENFASVKLNTADGSFYLSTAENIANHKGFVVSFNLGQFFNTYYHPLWSYYQPLYPLISSMFIDHGGLVKIIKINILFFALNATLIFYIIQRAIPTFFNVLFIFFLVFSTNFFYPALFPWTEQFHFFCLIVTFILFLKYARSSKALFCLGILNGILMLVRVAHLYNFLAYLPVIFLGNVPWRQKFNRAAFFVGGFVLAFGLYQLFCLTCYHATYPEYAKPGVDYTLARLDSGIIYDINRVGIQAALGPFFMLKNFKLIGQHLWDFYQQMPFFLWPSMFYFFLPANKRQDGGLIVLCISQSIFTLLGYSFTFHWLSYNFESLRYSLIPYVFLSVAGWYCMYQGLSLGESLGKKIIGLVVLICLLIPQVNRFMTLKINLLEYPLWERVYYKDFLQGAQWVDKNLPKEILVASDEDQQGYFLHRPYISTPVGKSYNCTNLVLYNRIYSPDYYLLSSNLSDKCFTSIAHTKIFSNKTFRILKVIK